MSLSIGGTHSLESLVNNVFLSNVSPFNPKNEEASLALSSVAWAYHALSRIVGSIFFIVSTIF